MSTMPSPPSLADTIAALSKFIAVEYISPMFFQKHEHRVLYACTFLRIVANKYPLLEKAFREGLPLPLSKGSAAVAEALSQIAFTRSEAQWFDVQSTEVLKMLLPVTRDPELPQWLCESRWAIEGAFE